MTNREWLATLTNKEFVAWLCDDTLFTYTPDTNKVVYNRNYTPTRKEIALMFTNSRSGILSWLEEERDAEKEKMTKKNKKTVNDIKFNIGDRVREASIGMIGVVVGIINDEILVKFDNFTAGHHGGTYFRANNMNYDKKDTSHLFVSAHQLEKVEKEIKSAHEKLLELGYVAKVKQDDFMRYELVVNEDKLERHIDMIQIYPNHKEFSVWRLIENHSTGSITADILMIKKDLAEILVEYLEELK